MNYVYFYRTLSNPRTPDIVKNCIVVAVAGFQFRVGSSGVYCSLADAIAVAGGLTARQRCTIQFGRVFRFHRSHDQLACDLPHAPERLGRSRRQPFRAHTAWPVMTLHGN